MQLTEGQVAEFHETGFLFLAGCLEHARVVELQRSLETVLGCEGPEVIRESSGRQAARLVFGAHELSPAMGRLARSSELVEPNRQLLEDDIYLHQSRLNPKLGLGEGGGWTWHQDYPPWKTIDGMARPDCVVTGVFLDDCTAVNSPLLVIPGSHHHGLLESRPLTDSASDGYDLHHITTDDVTSLASQHGIEPLIGPAGSVALLHCNLVHGSSNNVSPWRRAILYLVYNAVSNACLDETRPWYQNNRDFTPL